MVGLKVLFKNWCITKTFNFWTNYLQFNYTTNKKISI